MIKTIMFDLDGTLLPMDQDKFIELYFSNLAKKMAIKRGFDPQKLIKAVWTGTEAMFKNDGSLTNEERFFQIFDQIMEVDHNLIENDFTEFYLNEFIEAKKACGYNPISKEVIKLLKEKGYRLICMTNPLFPTIATYQRLNWAGTDASDFDFVTTYETSHYCKPNLNYYREILTQLSLDPEEVMMVGNDVDEDLIVKELGMKTFLITDCLLNKNNKEYQADFIGSMEDFKNYIINNF